HMPVSAHTQLPQATFSNQLAAAPGCERQLAGHPQGALDEQALDLLTAVDPTQPVLREPGERTGAVREEAIEPLDRSSHERDFALSPPLILSQQAQPAGVLPLPAGRQ